MKLLKYTFMFVFILSVTACTGLFSGSKNTLTVTFSNQSPFDICEVYVSTAKANDWGENKLTESEKLPANTEKSFTVKRGTYDLLARTCTKESMYSYHDVSKDFIAVIGGSGMLPIRASNNGKVEICFVYIAPAGTEGWGNDQLGGVESILPGSSRLFFVNPGIYNLRAEDCSNNILSEQEGFDPSAGMDWTIRP